MAGYSLSRASIEEIRKLVRQARRQSIKRPAAIRRVAYGTGGFPLRLAKPQTGQTLDGSTPGTSALCSIYAATPGSETAVQTDVPVYPGRALGSGNSIDDATYFLCGDVNGVLQFVSPSSAAAPTAKNWTTIWFTVDTADFTTSDASFTVTVTRVIGTTGIVTVSDTGVTVLNQPANNTPYMYSGTVGDAGQAYYDPDKAEWICNVLECTPA